MLYQDVAITRRPSAIRFSDAQSDVPAARADPGRTNRRDIADRFLLRRLAARDRFAQHIGGSHPDVLVAQHDAEVEAGLAVVAIALTRLLELRARHVQLLPPVGNDSCELGHFGVDEEFAAASMSSHAASSCPS
jgi:hypothetical protein